MDKPVDCFSGDLAEDDIYAWGKLFDSPWEVLMAGMSAKAEELGLVQDAGQPYLVWQEDGQENCRWVFVSDPSNVESVREIYNNEANEQSPCCYIVVRQVQIGPDGKRYDTRGDVIFDIFRLTPESYLWHHNRVYTPPV